MGAWADLEINPDVIEGLSKTGLSGRATGVFDTTLVTAKREAAAKDSVRRVLTARMAVHVSAAASQAAFFDTLAQAADLASPLQELLGLAFLSNYYLEITVTPGDRSWELSSLYKEEMKEGAVGFSRVAPSALSLTSGAVGAGRVSFLTAALDRYG